MKKKMCPSEIANNCRRSLLSNRVDSLYDNEIESDVVFLVGREPDVWRIPGHKSILSYANPVFHALFEGPLATQDNTVVIEDVESRAFDYLLRFLYGKDVKFLSASTALSTLYAAHKYLCSGLIELCVKYLDENLNTKNVLEIYSHARLYTSGDRKNHLPSAPVEDSISTASTDLIAEETRNHNNNVIITTTDRLLLEEKCLTGNSIFYWSEALLHNCLQHIDENADQVLSQESIEDLDFESLREIISRDTLKVKSEYVVFQTLDRWANRECKRRKLGVNPENRRNVLGNLIYEVRFPFMSPDEFILGPIQSGLLNQCEITVASALISKSKDVPIIPQEWESHIEKICRKRVHCENESFALSQRTYQMELDKTKEKDFKRNDSIFRKSKSKKKCTKDKNSSKAFRSMSVDSGRSDKKCSSCFAEYVFNILACIFD